VLRLCLLPYGRISFAHVCVVVVRVDSPPRVRMYVPGLRSGRLFSHFFLDPLCFRRTFFPFERFALMGNPFPFAVGAESMVSPRGSRRWTSLYKRTGHRLPRHPLSCDSHERVVLCSSSSLLCHKSIWRGHRGSLWVKEVCSSGSNNPSHEPDLRLLSLNASRDFEICRNGAVSIFSLRSRLCGFLPTWGFLPCVIYFCIRLTRPHPSAFVFRFSVPQQRALFRFLLPFWLVFFETARFFPLFSSCNPST